MDLSNEYTEASLICIPLLTYCIYNATHNGDEVHVSKYWIH